MGWRVWNLCRGWICPTIKSRVCKAWRNTTYWRWSTWRITRYQTELSSFSSTEYFHFLTLSSLKGHKNPPALQEINIRKAEIFSFGVFHVDSWCPLSPYLISEVVFSSLSSHFSALTHENLQCSPGWARQGWVCRFSISIIPEDFYLHHSSAAAGPQGGLLISLSPILWAQILLSSQLETPCKAELQELC